MPTEQLPLLFFKPFPSANLLAVAESLLNASPSTSVEQLDPLGTLHAVQNTRGFARLKIALPSFNFDSPRFEAAFEGTAEQTHIHVRFFGNFDKVAEPLYNALTALGLACYSVWDKAIFADWPIWEEPTVDSGFAARMTRILERKTLELRETVPDSNRRAQILAAFVKSPEFRAEMAAEARLEKPSRQKKAYSDLLNCYVRWKDGRASASELGAVRKLCPRFAAMSIAELRMQSGGSPRLLLLTAATARQAAELRRSAEQHGIALDIEPP